MALSPPPAPVDPTQLAQNLPGFDPAPVIAAVEQGLIEYLGKPIEQILAGLPLQHLPGQPPGPPVHPQQPPAAPADPEEPPDPGDAMNQIDPFQLIGPVVDVLGTLGSGLFSSIDPALVLRGISAAIDGTEIPLQQAIGAVAQDWQGESGAAADAKARGVLAVGTKVATQSDQLGGNLSTAAGNVTQGRQRMTDIVDQYQATMAAVDTSTPAGVSTAIAAANQATTESTALMEALQGTLGAQAEEVSAIGEAVLDAEASLLPTGWRPSEVLNTVFGDPRLTPVGVVGNVMDLFFLPNTVTELNAGIKETNATMARTNTIMLGLDEQMTTANGHMAMMNYETLPAVTDAAYYAGDAANYAGGAAYYAGDQARYAGDAAYYAGDAAYYAGDAAYYAGDAAYYAGDAAYYAGDGAYYAGDAANYAGDGAYYAGDAANYAGDATYYAGDQMGESTAAIEENTEQVGLLNERAEAIEEGAQDAVDAVTPDDPTNWGGGDDTPWAPW